MPPPTNLDEEIRGHERELARLYQRRRERDEAVFLLAVLEVLDGWFTAHELCALTRVSSTLSAHLNGASPKSVGRRLKQIADGQDRSDAIPSLRLLRHKTTSAATVWKIETYPPAGA